MKEIDIPKTIHYCWFGKGKKNKIFKKCIKSWRKYLPDYKIIEWNETNFDVNKNQYCREAYSLKKYAFVSDYARLKILYENGGIYFDTDVEVLKKIPNDILKNGYFAKERDSQIATGLGFCVPKNNKAIKCMLDDYNDIHFINNGIPDMTACPVRNSKSLEKMGFNIKTDNEIYKIKLYSKEFFCGFDLDTQHYIIDENTYTVHHYNSSWLPKNKKIIKKMKRVTSKLLGRKIYKKIANIKNGR